MLSSVIPDYGYADECLTFRSHHVTVQIYVDGEQIFSYGLARAEKGLFIGSGYNIFDFPDEYIGEVMEIVMVVQEDDPFGGLDVPLISESDEAYINICHHSGPLFIVSIFLVMIGLVIMVLGALAFCRNNIFLRLVYIGLFSLVLGLWCLGDTKMLQVIGVSMSANSTLKYLGFYMAPTVFLVLFMDIRKEISVWRLKLIQVTTFSEAVFLFAVATLHFTNVCHFTSFLQYYYVVVIAGMIIVAFASIGSRSKKDGFSSSIGWGLMILCSLACIEISRYVWIRYVLHQAATFTSNFISVGVLCFVIIMLVGYIMSLQKNMVMESEREWIDQHLYQDELTGLYNRTKYRATNEHLYTEHPVYAMINIDIDGLKSINDSLGHDNGDILISTFASILTQSFGRFSEIYRLGGDEFLVVVMEESLHEIDQALEYMENLCRRKSTEHPFAISASYGVARSTELVDRGPEQLYSMADQRMYDMKRKKKAARGIGRL